MKILSFIQDKSLDLIKGLLAKYEITEENWRGKISLRPKDVLIRSVWISNWSTVLVILILYPIIHGIQGPDYNLLTGMLLDYYIFIRCWIFVVCLLISFHISWIVIFFIGKRFFCENLLDFEVFDQIFGCDDDYENDFSDYDDNPFLNRRAAPSSLKKRASG